MKRQVVLLKLNPAGSKIRRTWGFNPVTRVHAPTKKQKIKKMRQKVQRLIKDF